MYRSDVVCEHFPPESNMREYYPTRRYVEAPLFCHLRQWMSSQYMWCFEKQKFFKETEAKGRWCGHDLCRDVEDWTLEEIPYDWWFKTYWHRTLCEDLGV